MTISLPFDVSAMRKRKEEYARFAQRRAAEMFRADGSYQPTTRGDVRLAYWVFPALVHSASPPMREFANAIYAAGSAWDRFDVFCASLIAVNLARHRDALRPDLVRRSEEYLARFIVADGGRAPCSGANDYIFHGYNDNMPTMSVRAMILAGEILGRADFFDRGMFHLEGLAAHFERRGLLSEYTSGTYTPIALTALMDVVECAAHREARDLALACAQRIALDLLTHWHSNLGALGGPQSRAYATDTTATFDNLNTLFWYWTGDPRCINPIEALEGDGYDGPMAHARNHAWNIASLAEMFSAGYESLSPEVIAFARAERRYPYEVFATSDSGQSGLLGGVKEIRTRAFHQPLYALGTASETWFGQSGEQSTLCGVLATTAAPRHWKDRVTFWHRAIEGQLDMGDPIVEKTGERPHSVPGKSQASGPVIEAETHDVGVYHTLQKRGSALVLGAVGTGLLDKEIKQLKLSLLFHTRWRSPDELVTEDRWHFLRFGEVYVGARASGMVLEQRKLSSCAQKNHYLRIEVPLVEGDPVRVTQEFREWCEFGYVLEMADREECGSFEQFRAQCRACSWEWYHGFYRTSRYRGRHGELQIIDSVAAGTVRFMAIDGRVEPSVKFAATGLDPALTQLFPDGRKISQRRLVYSPDFIGSPFYAHRNHIIESDVPRHAPTPV